MTTFVDELLDALAEFNLTKRYDIAIMSTKGMSVTAARALAENVCGTYGVPLLLLRDFDIAGFAISASFQKDTRRYQFQQPFEVIDLGLRLEDAESWGLVSEEVYFKPNPRSNLEENGATADEIAYRFEGGGKGHCRNRRPIRSYASWPPTGMNSTTRSPS